MTADSVSLSPKHAGGVTELSRQLIMQSSPDVEQLVRDEFAYAIAKGRGCDVDQPRNLAKTVTVE